MINGKTSSRALLMASSDSEVALSPSHLHRHSPQTWSKDMAPLAKSTMERAHVEGRGGNGVRWTLSHLQPIKVT